MPGRFKSRKFLLAAVGQLTGLAVLFFPSFESQITQAASHAGALLLMALSAMGYLAAEGRVDAERERGRSEVEAERERARADSARTGRRLTPLVLLLAATGVTAGGCAVLSPDRSEARPADRVAMLRADLTAVQDGLVAAYRSGALEADAFAATRPVVYAVRGALERAAEEPPESDTWEAWLAEAEEGLAELERVLETQDQERSDGRTGLDFGDPIRAGHDRLGFASGGGGPPTWASDGGAVERGARGGAAERCELRRGHRGRRAA